MTKKNYSNIASEHHTGLARVFSLFENKTSVGRITYVLFAVCLLLLGADLFYYKKTYFDIENLPGVYGIYGFLVCCFIVLIARIIAGGLQREDDYYAPKDVTSETMPFDEIQERSIE